MVTSDFRPEVEIRPFRACAMKNTQYNAHLWLNRRNSRVLKDVALRQIPRSTERISSSTYDTLKLCIIIIIIITIIVIDVLQSTCTVCMYYRTTR